MSRRFAIRSQGDLEAELLFVIERLQAADPANEERVSWWAGQALAYMIALGAERNEALRQVYMLWRSRNRKEQTFT